MKNKKKFYILICSTSIVVVMVLLIIIFTQGKTYISNNSPSVFKMDSISCRSAKMIFPGIRDEDADEKNMNITLIFKNDNIESIGIKYSLRYNSDEAARNAEVISQSELSTLTGKAGLGSVDSLNHKFSTFNNQLFFSLFVKKNDITNAASPFLLLTDDKTIQIESMKKNDYIDNYTKLGFTCDSN